MDFSGRKDLNIMKEDGIATHQSMKSGRPNAAEVLLTCRDEYGQRLLLSGDVDGPGKALKMQSTLGDDPDLSCSIKWK